MVRIAFMIDMDNQSGFETDTTMLERIMKQLDAQNVELLICDNDTMRALNRQYRHIDKATDVLSFPFEAMPMAPLGSIVINSDRVKEEAKVYGHGANDEFALLFLHGLLHLLGYDHETDSGEMRRKEEEVIKALKLPQSLIVRTVER